MSSRPLLFRINAFYKKAKLTVPNTLNSHDKCSNIDHNAIHQALQLLRDGAIFVKQQRQLNNPSEVNKMLNKMDIIVVSFLAPMRRLFVECKLTIPPGVRDEIRKYKRRHRKQPKLYNHDCKVGNKCI